MIRAATEADIPGILPVWNALIRDTTVTFAEVEKTPGELAGLLRDKAEAGLPFLVAEAEGAILGFASFGPFRSGSGYRQSFEHSLCLVPAAWGRGLGRALMARIEAAARAAGGHVLVAGVSGENAAGIAFHTALGFVETGRMPEVGFKFGRRLDLVLMQKRL